MPNTSNYGFDYESPSSLPGVTLTGGPTTSSPILAVQADAALASVENTVSAHAADIAALEASDVTINTSLTHLSNWSRRGSTSGSLTALSSIPAVFRFGVTFPSTPTVITTVDS